MDSIGKGRRRIQLASGKGTRGLLSSALPLSIHLSLHIYHRLALEFCENNGPSPLAQITMTTAYEYVLDSKWDKLIKKGSSSMSRLLLSNSSSDRMAPEQTHTEHMMIFFSVGVVGVRALGTFFIGFKQYHPLS